MKRHKINSFIEKEIESRNKEIYNINNYELGYLILVFNWGYISALNRIKSIMKSEEILKAEGEK